MIRAGFRERLTGNRHIIDIRGQGLMIGIELDAPCTELAAAALARGLLINVTADSTIRLLPPLILSDDEARHLMDGVACLVNDHTAA
jgi:acetylornithine aminotransferase